MNNDQLFSAIVDDVTFKSIGGWLACRRWNGRWLAVKQDVKIQSEKLLAKFLIYFF